MSKIISIIASALLLGYLITELSTRFYTDNYFALLVMTVIALVINGLFVVKVAGTSTSSTQKAPRQQPNRASNQNKNRQAKGNRRDSDRNRNRGNHRGEGRVHDRDRDRTNQQSKVPQGNKEEGEVKWFNRSKGYGFIIRPNQEEIFVHQRSIISEDGRSRPVLRDGQQVSYVVTKNERGEQAEHVKALD